MALKIKWSPRTASNLEDICNYISKDSEYYAILFAKKVTAIIKTIPQFPKSGRLVPEYNDENLTQKMQLNIYYDLKSAIQAVLRKEILTLKYSNIPSAKIFSAPCL